VKDLALVLLLVGFAWYPIAEIILHKLRPDSAAPITSLTFFLHLTQSFIPLVLAIAAAVLYFR
jgi:hypothetical protein